MRRFNLSTISIMALALFAGTALMPATARGQIFVADEFNDAIGEYNLDGTTVNAALVSGLNVPSSIAVSGSDLFVVNSYEYGPYTNTIGEYTTSGATVNASMISGLDFPHGIAVSGPDLFVVAGQGVTEYTTSGAVVNSFAVSGPAGVIAISGSDVFVTSDISGYDTIGEYTTSGAVVNASLVSGLDEVEAIAVSGSDLFVADVNDGNNTISEYTTSGTLVNASLISAGQISATSIGGIAVSGSDLFITVDNGMPGSGEGIIGEYTTSGATVNTSLVSGLDVPDGIAVVAPEPATTSLLSVAATAALLRRQPARMRYQGSANT